MTSRSLAGLALAAIMLVVAPACQRDLTDLDDAEFPGNAEIFIDGYAEGVTYQAFAGSKTDAVAVDQTVFYQGSSSLRIDVPVPSNPGGSYAGGAFTSSTLRDLTEYNAVTFWARASMPAGLNVAGLGNNNTGESLYTAETYDLQLTTDWQQYAIPFPLASRLDQEDGLFFFAEGSEDGNNGYTFWIDELRFADLSTVSNPRPVIGDRQVDVEVGDTVMVSGASVTYEVSGQDITVAAAPAYFDYASSDEAVATVDSLGQIVIVGEGSADITASLGAVAATGTVAVTTEGPPTPEPATAAPAPTQDAGDVISLFSDAYTDVPVDTWLAGFSAATLDDVTIDGSAMKKYEALDFAGIEFVGANSIDASGMTHVRMDVWTPDATSFSFKFVDFGADGAYGGGDDSENALITFDASSTPALATGSWVSIDVPLSELTAAGLGSLTNLSQLIIVGQPTGATTVYVDNVYFYNDGATGGATAPDVAAPTPTQDAGDVISLFSDAYTDVPVDAFITSWSAATLTDTTAAGDAVKKYSGLDFAGIEFVGANSIDASGMTHVRMDVWTPDATAFSFKLVDFGADGAAGGGDDSENTLVRFDASSTPALATGSWVSIDVPLSELTAAGLGSLTNLSQLIIVGEPTSAATVYVDNIYFYNDGATGGATAPDVAAPTPTQDAGDVISLFSDAYTDVPVDTWRTDWSAATLTDTTAAGDAVKKYSGLDFVGVEFVGANSIDASGMTHVRMDVWTADATSFSFKFVDFGADGAFGGGDDSENVPVTIDASSTPALATGSWVSIDVPLSELTAAGLGSLTNLSQLVLVGQPTGAATVFVDNVYFYNDGSTGGATAPDVAAPTPTQDAGNVISLFSDAYTDVPVDTWRTDWSAATLTDTTAAGDAVKKYSGLDFVGIETVGSQIDATAMTHIHLDIWTPDATFFAIKLVDFGPDGGFQGGDDTEFQVNFDGTANPVPGQGQWVSLDIPLSDFTGMNFGHLAQMILVGQPTGATTVFVDNVYFYAQP